MTTVNEMLAVLNVDELSPLEALTKLAELKRLAAGERVPVNGMWKNAPGMWNGYAVYRDDVGSPVIVLRWDGAEKGKALVMDIGDRYLYTQEETFYDFLKRWPNYPEPFSTD